MDTAIAKRRPRALGRKAIERIQSGLAMLILSAGAIVILIPLAWMISTSLKSDVELFKNPGFIPWDWKWDNFSHAWNSVPFNTFFKNSVIITVLAVIGTLISNSLVAYGFARLNFKGKKWFFGILLGTMMIPGSVLMIPSYILYSRLGWVNTFLPLIVPNFFSSAFYVFLLRQFMVGIPKDYSEAAHIEGANEFTIYARIILPLSKPALISIAIFEFTAKWNDFMGPLLYLNSEEKYTLQLGLRMFQSATGFEWQLFMAASIIVLLPTVLVFFVLQRYFIEGLAMSGMKN